MPAPSKTSPEAIFRAVIALADEGVELTMSAVAKRVGVSSPSLHARYLDLRTLRAGAADYLFDLLLQAVRRTSERERERASEPNIALGRLATTFRNAAREHQGAYRMLLPQLAPEKVLTLFALLEPGFQALKVEDPEHSARALATFLIGFSTLELGDAYRNDGGSQVVFESGLQALVPRPPR